MWHMWLHGKLSSRLPSGMLSRRLLRLPSGMLRPRAWLLLQLLMLQLLPLQLGGCRLPVHMLGWWQQCNQHQWSPHRRGSPALVI